MYSLYCYTKILLDKSLDYLTYNGTGDTSDRIYSHSLNHIDRLISLYSNPTQICPNIYLGNCYNARNYYNLIDIKVGLVVNCTEEIDNHFPESFEYIRIPIRDSSDSSMLDYIDNTVDRVHEFLETNPHKSVLFHCFMGSSRSTSFLLAYLVKYMDMDLNRAIKLVKELRPIVNINSNFYRELEQIYK